LLLSAQKSASVVFCSRRAISFSNPAMSKTHQHLGDTPQDGLKFQDFFLHTVSR
jgi:hypothetical protein